jgi:hypothetical protein
LKALERVFNFVGRKGSFYAEVEAQAEQTKCTGWDVIVRVAEDVD